MRNSLLYLCLCFVVVCAPDNSIAQGNEKYKFNQVDLTLGINSSHSTISIAYQYNRRMIVGKKRNNKPLIMELGFGGRFTSFSGRNLYFPTVPETGGWGYRDTDLTHMDSVFVSQPQIFALNTLVNFAFCIKDRFRIGATVDIIGFSFGGNKSGTYNNGSETQAVTISPEQFNLAIYGTDQLGSLDIEYYAAYEIGGKWSAKLGLQWIIMEYVTTTKVQQYPEPNDRFRNESFLFSIGVVYRIH